MIFTPRDSKASALPDDPEIALFPCFATFIPAPATTNATAVEILNVFSPSPPVPHVSRRGSSRSIFKDLSLIAVAKPAISVGVSPFIFIAIIKAPNWAGVTSPLIISFIDNLANSKSKSSLLVANLIACNIFLFFII